jgi:hypothetical protein
MRYYFIIMLCLSVTVSSAQSIPDSTKAALLRAERALYEAESDSLRVYLVLEKAALYRGCSQHRLAVRELERGVTWVRDSSLAGASWKYELLYNAFLAGDLEKVYAWLQRFPAWEAGLAGHEADYLYLRWMTLAEMNEFKKAKSEMHAYAVIGAKDSLKSKVDLLDTAPARKRARKARILSAALPGAGAVYAGYPLRGATAFALSAGFAGLTAFLVTQQLYVAALASGFSPLSRFYRGNIRLAEKLADRKSEENRLRLLAAYAAEARALLIQKK